MFWKHPPWILLWLSNYCSVVAAVPDSEKSIWYVNPLSAPLWNSVVPFIWCVMRWIRQLLSCQLPLWCTRGCGLWQQWLSLKSSTLNFITKKGKNLWWHKVPCILQVGRCTHSCCLLPVLFSPFYDYTGRTVESVKDTKIYYYALEKLYFQGTIFLEVSMFQEQGKKNMYCVVLFALGINLVPNTSGVIWRYLMFNPIPPDPVIQASIGWLG